MSPIMPIASALPMSPARSAASISSSTTPPSSALTPLGPLAVYPVDRLDEVFAINVFAPLALIQELLPLLRKRAGLVVNISSDAALGGYPGWGAYGASKAALDLVSLTLANELTDSGVARRQRRSRRHAHRHAPVGLSRARIFPIVRCPTSRFRSGPGCSSQDRGAITGRRFQAQADSWELARVNRHRPPPVASLRRRRHDDAGGARPCPRRGPAVGEHAGRPSSTPAFATCRASSRRARCSSSIAARRFRRACPPAPASDTFSLNLSTRYGPRLWLAEPRWSAATPGPLPLAPGDRP